MAFQGTRPFRKRFLKIDFPPTFISPIIQFRLSDIVKMRSNQGTRGSSLNGNFPERGLLLYRWSLLNQRFLVVRAGNK